MLIDPFHPPTTQCTLTGMIDTRHNADLIAACLRLACVTILLATAMACGPGHARPDATPRPPPPSNRLEPDVVDASAARALRAAMQCAQIGRLLDSNCTSSSLSHLPLPEGSDTDAALVAMLSDPDPEVRDAVATTLSRRRRALEDATLIPDIVAAVAAERDPVPARSMGMLAALVRREASYAPDRAAIERLLVEHELLELRLALIENFMVGMGTRAEDVSLLVARVLDPEERLDAREAALSGFTKPNRGFFSFSIATDKGRAGCDALLDLARGDSEWAPLALLQASTPSDGCFFVRPKALLEVLGAHIPTSGAFDPSIATALVALAQQVDTNTQSDVTTTLSKHTQDVAQRTDLPIGMRIDALAALTLLDPEAARPLVANLSAPPGSAHSERLDGLKLALTPAVWLPNATAPFHDWVRATLVRCHLWAFGAVTNCSVPHGVQRPEGDDGLLALAAALTHGHPALRRLSAQLLPRMRFRFAQASFEAAADAIIDASLVASDAETTSALANLYRSYVRRALHGAPDGVAAALQDRLIALAISDREVALRVGAATALADVKKHDDRRTCSLLSELASSPEPELSRVAFKAFRCGRCDEQWGMTLDRLSTEGLRGHQLGPLLAAHTKRTNCARSRSTATSLSLNDLGTQLVAALLDGSIPTPTRTTALIRYHAAGLLDADALGVLSEDAEIGAHATRLATYARLTPEEDGVGLRAAGNDPLWVARATTPLTQCVWEGAEPASPSCKAWKDWLAHTDDGAPTLLELLLDPDPAVRTLAAAQLERRPRWHRDHPPRKAELLGRLEAEEDARVASRLARVAGAMFGSNPGLDGRIDAIATSHPEPSVRARTLEGMSAHDPAASLPHLIRAASQDPSRSVRRVAAEMLRAHAGPPERDGALCGAWLDLTGSPHLASVTAGIEGSVGLRCMRATRDGHSIGERAVARWDATLADGDNPDWLRVAALRALERTGRTDLGRLDALATTDGAVADEAKELAHRRRSRSADRAHPGLLDTGVTPALSHAIESLSRCTRIGWSDASCGATRRWRDATASHQRPPRKHDPNYTPHPDADVDAALLALLHDPDPRLRWFAVITIERRMKTTPTPPVLVDAVRAIAAYETSEPVQGHIERFLQTVK
jgi:HEAT repeat protein